MGKIGILTFHYALNCGSVLQAQATQAAIEKLGYDCELVDYRFMSDEAYDRLYTDRGRRRTKLLRRALFALQGRARSERIKNFQAYARRFLRLSAETYPSFEALKSADGAYDLFVSGSDQVWSDFVVEIRKTDPALTKGYFLAFTNKPKVAYASCIASMGEKELTKYKPDLDAYDRLSTREKHGADILRHITGRDIPIVLDPSFLLTKEDWAAYTDPEPLIREKYILLYSLRNGAAQKSWLDAIRAFNADKKMKVVVLAPYFYWPMTGVDDRLASGPDEFLNLFLHAELVLTDSFHGTAFAVNFNRPVYSLGTKYWKDDPRKTYLLGVLGMEDRILSDESDIASVRDYAYDYREVNARLNALRDESLAYLRDSLSALMPADQA